MSVPDVSAVITTFNRRELVSVAIRSVLAQSRPVTEILVIDDGSVDGTREHLRQAFGDRIRYVWQANAGVSAARNRGLLMARGRYLALLDSDDRWHPEKTRLQLDWLDARPDFGMVVSDVVRVDDRGRQIDVLRRRPAIPRDGDVLQWVLFDPVLVPASAMLRREVFETVGGFDTGLATAEDLDFHLRVARHWKIGVIEQALTTALRGHDGLSAARSTYSDYARVFERFIPSISDRLPSDTLNRALSLAYERSARGLILEGRWQKAFHFARRAWLSAPTLGDKLHTLELTRVAARRIGGVVKKRLRS
jgi:glycosyltransferase involved in cell wall biosynthesis